MADGLNDARAMRIAEIMTDFRTYQQRVSSMQATASAQEYSLPGYSVLRQCQAEAQAVLATHFDSGAISGRTGDPEQTKRQLQRILFDSSARRFRVYKIMLKAQAAMRWVQARLQTLGGRPPSPSKQGALRNVDNTLRTELAGITDMRLFSELKNKDQAAGHWVAEMPDLTTLLNYIRTH